MEFLTDEIIERAIRSQRAVGFDSHDIMFTLMTYYPREYVQELHEALNSDQDPFVKLHTDTAKRMASKYLSHVVRKHGGKTRTLNCRGKKDLCQLWQRIV